MATNNDVFNKEWEDERDKNNLEGLLEQLNLPPAAIKFVKHHKRAVQLALALIIIAVVAWALYGSYRDDKIQKSSAALSSAMELEGQAMLDKLAEVEQKFSGTDAALWAEITTAQQLMKNGNMEEAGAAYQSVRDKLGKKSPLLPLVIFAMAQIDETLERYESSSTGYQALVEVEGYEELGYLGLARINELQGKPAEALAVYEQYLDSIEDAATLQRAMVEEKIARLRAEQ